MADKSAKKARKAIYVLSTHWDREWYQSFQNYCYQLVHLLDAVIDGLEDRRLKGPFTCDGQAIVIEDYLEVRPEKRLVVEKLAREGRLVVGPWYVLPDEFLVSGEAMVRNLRLGREIARSLGGKPSNAGWVCDLFGHASQMPQMLRGFGIEAAFLWRGVNLPGRRHVIWRGADGTELPCFRFGGFGYCDYSFAVRNAHRAEEPFDAEAARARLQGYLESEAAETEIDTVLMFDGGDHQVWDQRVYKAVADRLGRKIDGFVLEHGTLDDYCNDLVKQARAITTRLDGELRDTAINPHKQTHIIHGVLASRVWIKQANVECQDKLALVAEPLATLANLALGEEYPQGFLDVAWRHLLQNHPHDSICGCSIDAVHEDMKFRFAQARQIADRLTLEATRALTASVAGDVGDDEIRLGVFNPLATPHRGVAELTLDIPSTWPTWGEWFGFEAKPAFTIHDAAGNEVPYQRLSQLPNQVRGRLYPDRFPHHYTVTEVRVALAVDVPAMGYTTLSIRAGKAIEPTRYPQTPSLVTGERMMENEHLAIRLERNGTLTITDKRTGEVYDDLLTFEDASDIGDGWYHGAPTTDELFVSSGASAEIALIDKGPQTADFRIRTTMAVPAEFDFARMSRVERRADIVIETLVRLRAGEDHVEFDSKVTNSAKDHRLRVLFPTGAEAASYLSDTPFDVVERPVALVEDNHLRAELDVETKPQQSWTAVTDGRRGAVVTGVGLLEACVQDNARRTLALTLLRATRRTVMTNGEPEGQLQGTLRFRYAFAPLGPVVDRARLFALAQHVGNGLRHVHVGRHEQGLHRRPTAVPATAGLFEVDGGAVLTSARRVGKAVEVRVFNPATERVKASISWAAAGKAIEGFGKAERVDFESGRIDAEVTLKKNSVVFALEPKEIATVRLV